MNTNSTAMTITEVFPSCQAHRARIHAAGCRDIARDVAKATAQGFGPAEQHTSTCTPQQWLEANFGDAAADETKEGTEEWQQELRYQAAEVKVCSCARYKGFTF